MDWQRTLSNLKKIIPIAFLIGLAGDWLRLVCSHPSKTPKAP